MSIEYFAAPNKYRKWWREVEKAESKLERLNLKKVTSPDKIKSEDYLTNTEWYTLSQSYYDEELAKVNAILKEDYPQYSLVELVLGFFMYKLNVAVNPHEWFVIGTPKTVIEEY